MASSAHRNDQAILTIVPIEVSEGERSRPADARGERIHGTLLSFACLLIVFSPLWFGGNTPVFRAATAIGVFAVAALCASLLIGKRISENPFRGLHEIWRVGTLRMAPIFAAFVAVSFIAALQLVPLPVSLLRIISARTAELYQWVGATSGTVSFHRESTLEALIWLSASGLFFFGTVTLRPMMRTESFAGRRRYDQLSSDTKRYLEEVSRRDDVVDSILRVIVWSGLISGIIAAAHWASGSELYFGRFDGGRSSFNNLRAHFPFVNSDHLSVLFEMSGIAALIRFFQSYGFIRLKSANLQGASSRRPTPWFFEQKSIVALLPLALSCFSLLVLSLLTASRAGVSLLFLGSFLYSIYAMQTVRNSLPLISRARHSRSASHRSFNWLKYPIIVIGVVITFAFFLGGMGRDLITQRVEYGLAAGYDEVRYELARLAWSVFRDFPLTGVGLGALESAAPLYMTDSLMGWRIDYAHNEYLQLAAEVGILGIGFALFALGATVVFAVRSIRRASNPMRKIELVGILICCLLPLFHSLVDFPFRIPSIAITFLAISGALYRALIRSEGERAQ